MQGCFPDKKKNSGLFGNREKRTEQSVTEWATVTEQESEERSFRRSSRGEEKAEECSFDVTE